jgi:hypothetical protein
MPGVTPSMTSGLPALPIAKMRPALIPMSHLNIPCLFRVSYFVFRVSDFGFRVADFNHAGFDPDVAFEHSLRVAGVMFRAASFLII